MLHNLSALAIVPKAKAIGAQRLTREDYNELMRRKSVLEVMTTLQSHPYFKRSLGGLSPTNLHRAQIEEALSKDVFYKYERLMHYSFHSGHFGAYFQMRCEIDELEHKLRLMSLDVAEQYIVQLPGFLTEHASFDLLRLAAAKSPEECLHVLAGTPYARVLERVFPQKGKPLEFLAVEHALETYYYSFVFRRIEADLSGRSAADTRELFLYEAEIYNLDLLFRAKAFYPNQFTPRQLKKLLLPFYGVLAQNKLEMLADTHDLESFLHLYNHTRAGARYGERTTSLQAASDVQAYRSLYAKADRLLHFSCTPQTLLAAVLCIANLERSNIVNIIEGVRYGLPPEKISQVLKRAW